MSRSAADHVATALALLDEAGPATAGPGLSMSAMAAASGRSRSSVYRHWPTAEDLNADLTRFEVVDLVGWQRRVLDVAPEVPLADALASAVDRTPGAEPGLWARCGMAAWPADHPVRTEAAAWERAWLVAFEAWVGAHLRAHGRQVAVGSERVLALAIAGLVEGSLLLDLVWSLPDDPAWYTGRTGDLATAVLRVVEVVTEPGPMSADRHDRRREALPTTDIAGARRAALEQAAATYATAPPGSPVAASPGRLVDTGRLARRLQVSERRTFDLWPTTTDLNAALITAIGARQLASFDDVAQAVMDLGLAEDHDRPLTPINISGLQRYVETAARPVRIHTFPCTAALRDPVVRAAFIDTTIRSAGSIRTIFLAFMTMSGTRLEAGVAVDEYLAVVRASVGGIQRLATLQPELVDEVADLHGHEVPACGFAAYLPMEALTTHAPRPPGERRLTLRPDP